MRMRGWGCGCGDGDADAGMGMRMRGWDADAGMALFLRPAAAAGVGGGGNGNHSHLLLSHRRDGQSSSSPSTPQFPSSVGSPPQSCITLRDLTYRLPQMGEDVGRRASSGQRRGHHCVRGTEGARGAQGTQKSTGKPKDLDGGGMRRVRAPLRAWGYPRAHANPRTAQLYQSALPSQSHVQLSTE